MTRQIFEEKFVASVLTADTDFLMEVAWDILNDDEDILKAHEARCKNGCQAASLPVIDTLWHWGRETGHEDSFIPESKGEVGAHWNYLESLQARALGKVSQVA